MGFSGSASQVLPSGVPYIDIRDTGGTSNLSFNNTTAFNSALSLLGANGGAIFFPIGEWRGDFRVNQNNVTLYGMGGDGDVNLSCLRPWTTAQWGLTTAGSFVVGSWYEINTVGTTDFTGCGAGWNVIGVQFRATTAGSGTGTARLANSATLFFGEGGAQYRQCGIRDLAVSGDDGSGNLADLCLGIGSEVHFSAIRFQLMQGIHTLRLEPRGGFACTCVYLSYFQLRNDNTTNAISAITKANPAVVTVSTVSAANPFAVNMRLSIGGLTATGTDDVVGMTQINQLSSRVTAVGGVSGAWTVTLGDIDSTAFGTYTSGGFTFNASARAILAKRNDAWFAGQYLTDINMTHYHVNGPPGACTAMGMGAYAMELDGKGSNGFTLATGFGYIDPKSCRPPAGTNSCGGVLFRNANETMECWTGALDPGTTGVPVVEANSSSQNPTDFIVGRLIWDAQYFKNTTSNIPIPSGAVFTVRQPLLYNPYVMLSTGLTITNALDPYGNKAADTGVNALPWINSDTTLGPITLNNADFAVVNSARRVALGSIAATPFVGTTTNNDLAIRTNNASVGTFTVAGDLLFRGVAFCRRATAIETRTSTTTLTNSTQLTYAIPAAGTYEFEILVFSYFTTAVTDGMTANVNYSGTFTAVGSYLCGELTNGSTTDLGIQPVEVSATVNNALAGLTLATYGASVTSAAPAVHKIKGNLIATGTGTLAFAFAQAVSGVDTSNLGVGSWMKVTQLS